MNYEAADFLVTERGTGTVTDQTFQSANWQSLLAFLKCAIDCFKLPWLCKLDSNRYSVTLPVAGCGTEAESLVMI